MARDPLSILRTVRQRAVEQARQALAVCLRAETEASGAVNALVEAAERDREVALGLGAGHEFLDMFANRLEALRVQQIAAAAALQSAQDSVSEALALVVAARTQAEALEQLAAQRKAAEDAELERKAQHVLDDIARGRNDVARR
jgi:flagellar biosynthesis chaperone FliJ